MKILQRIHTLADEIPDRRETGPETSLMELKQLWLMSRCYPPLASHRNAEFLNSEVPGMTIPAEYRKRMAKVGSGPAARAEGIAIAREALGSVKDRVAGAYVMPPFNRVDAALAVLEVARDRMTTSRSS